MNTQIQDSFVKFQKQKAAFLAHIENATTKQRSFKPAPTSWCMTEVADHLAISEVQVLEFLNKYEARPLTLMTKLKGNLNRLLLNFVLNSPLKVKIPNGVDTLVPSQNIDFETVKTNWEQTTQSFEAYLAAFPSEKLTYSVFKHPLGASFTIAQTIDFCTTHMHHHTMQLERIKADTNFPKAKS
ncbi:MAG: DinB family protein [Chitinophagales bacterium]